jgi:peptidoglycan/LPS O-acetylase OafA/YrhL
MNKQFSLYLDIVRFSAAMLVVLAHFCQRGVVSDEVQRFLPQLGREAVVVFFVLSGFVIGYTTSVKSLTLRQYAAARCARIYSVALPILLITLLAVAFAVLVCGKSVAGSYQLNKLYLYLPLHLLFAGELWHLTETPPWLLPYWSLGYEVWYYVLFGALFYARGKARIALVLALLAVMGPKLWLLLPVWMSGLLLYRQRLHLGVTPARLGWALTILALVLYKASGSDLMLRALGSAIWPFPGFKLGSADRYLADYVVGTLVFLNFLFAREADFSMPARLAALVRTLAAYTFTLYLIHTPVMGMWEAFYAHDNSSWRDIAALGLCIALACYLAGFVTERRRGWFRQRFERLFTLAAPARA